MCQDPLIGFDWNRLCQRYDAETAPHFNQDDQLLIGPFANLGSDRALYSRLLQEAQNGDGGITIPWYKAMLYWKHRGRARRTQAQLNNEDLDSSLQSAAAFARGILNEANDVEAIWNVTRDLPTDHLPMMNTVTAIPTRTTFLHFLFPEVVPIFDQMVLRAVGMWGDGANNCYVCYRRYLSCAHDIAQHIPDDARNADGLVDLTPLRILDMALWVVGHNGG